MIPVRENHDYHRNHKNHSLNNRGKHDDCKQ